MRSKKRYHGRHSFTPEVAESSRLRQRTANMVFSPHPGWVPVAISK